MSARCRTCGKIIYCVNAKNLFQQPDNIMLHQIAALTGIFLTENMEFPTHICGPCEVALREAIVFRERIIKTQKVLLSSCNNIEEAFNKIDSEEVENLELEEDAEDIEQETTQEEPTENDTSGENNDLQQQSELNDDGQPEESVQQNEIDKESTVDAPAPAPSLARKPGKPQSKLYATVNFATNTRNTPRINWSKLSEEEIVALKRERRKRDCICELCGRHFTCPSNFKVHLLRHTGIKNFSCKQCPLKFYTPHLLRRHELAHLCEKPYPCQYCGQTFADHSGRIQHERNRHTNYRPYKCTKCEKEFAVSNKLKRHMLSHSGVRSFPCEICKVSFLRRPHLTAHYRSKGHEQNAQNFTDLANAVDIDIESVLQ
ncbi:PREDICTED: transcription factor Ouib [Drosophila arizonae]|uniref:Transcription factor Ouib n=1 Tax=Drosophila arizonae TaxID=7263 RepID=A0ABM1NSY5_DROAR|nr:PREDICTED: transcription factor Ouib [Drosophila arizonae]